MASSTKELSEFGDKKSVFDVSKSLSDLPARPSYGQISSELPANSVSVSDKSLIDLINQLKSMICSDPEGEEKEDQVVEVVKEEPQVQAQALPPKSKRTYTREYLFWCSQYESSNVFPEELSALVSHLPKIIKPFGNSGLVRVFQTSPKTSQNPRPSLTKN